MHLKLYSSTMLKNTEKVSLPKSHPSYNKDPIKMDILHPTTKKRLDMMRTTYNFLKNYY